MANSIEFARNYVSVIDKVYQRAAVSHVLNSGPRMVRAGHNAREIVIPRKCSAPRRRVLECAATRRWRCVRYADAKRMIPRRRTG